MKALRSLLVVVGAMAVLVGTLAGVVHREVLSADRFADRVEDVRSDPYVARHLGVLVTEELIEREPDLVAIRPVLESTATAVIATPTLGPVVRTAVRPLYEVLTEGGQDVDALRLADLAAVVVGVVNASVPGADATVPADLDVQLSRLGGQGYNPDVARWVHVVGWLAWLGPLLGVLLLAGAGVLRGRSTGSRGVRSFVRPVLSTIGQGAIYAAAGLGALLVVASFVIGRADRGTLSGAIRHAVWNELDGAFWVAAGLVAAAGFLLTVVARMPTDVTPRALAETAWRAMLEPGRGLRPRLARVVTLLLVGTALVLQPLEVVRAVVWLLGAGLAVLAVGLLIGIIVDGVRAISLNRVVTSRWRAALAAPAALALLGVFTVLAWPADDDLAAAPAFGGSSRQCNGHVELCGRTYDSVAFPATHNSMSAASEPGWFFAEQPDGIIDQLDNGIRVLLIDSWYGSQTDRPGIVATAGDDRAKALAEARSTFGDATVTSALRVRDALQLTPRGPVEPYLCHAMCELGSTKWLSVMRQVREWMEAHPNEVVTVFVQDEVSPADTAEVVREAGLLPYVYTPGEDGEWPTLGQLVDSGQRLVFLMENHGGGAAYPWLLDGFRWVQDTPYLFHAPAEFSCAANRGDADASLFLVNHWITDKTRLVSNAIEVNARDVLLPRVEQCKSERGMLPNYVAVDFYNRGDLMPVVDNLNGLD